MRLSEIIDELALVLKGKTMDALIPPLIFLVVNLIGGIIAAISLSIITALIIGIMRLYRKQSIKYAFGGLAGVIIASLFAFLTENVNNYFMAGAVRSAALFILAFGSIILRKPIAALASHISRGWPLEWFWRKDVKKAYFEVTIVWSLLFLFRFILQMFLLIEGDTGKIVWANLLLGWPFNLAILILSYIYGIWRLQNLGGPGVDEFIEGKEPPWQGQKKGF